MGAIVKVVSLAMILSLLPTLPAASAGPPSGDAERFIVVLEDGANPRGIAQQAIDATGGRVGFLYEHSIKGFLIEMPSAALNGLRRLPGVDYIEPDVEVTIAGQLEPTGYDRIDADLNPGAADYSGVDIAIIDTGVWYVPNGNEVHEDLNLVWVADCTGAMFYPLFGGCVGGGVDGNGHGTHVAGIAAACDNDIGSLGVAPCATLWSIKALGDDGTGSLGSVVAAVDLVAANADQIEVANMSLSFQGEAQSLTGAIDAAVAKGVAFVVAAGNSSVDASLHSPASVDSAITVSSVTDYDGAPGGIGSETCYPDTDDTLAAYSNYGPKVDIAAPGTCIYSTYLNHGYATYSGTSMAAPTVAGAVARYFHDRGIDPTSAADVEAARNAIVDGGMAQTGACGFGGDTDGFAEPLLFLNGPAFGGNDECGDGGAPPANTPPTAAITTPVSCTYLDCSFDGSGSTDDEGIVSYSWDFGDTTTASGPSPSHTYASAGTYTVVLTVADAGSLSDTTSVVVTVEEPPSNLPPTAVITTATCIDLDCSFDGSDSSDDTGITGYTWDFGDGTTATGVSVSHSYVAAGTYSVTLTVEDAAGLNGSDTTTVTATAPSGPIGMTTAVAGFTHDGTWASVPLWVLDVTLAFNGVGGAEVLGEWTYLDRRGRERSKQVTGTTDDQGFVTIRSRFKNTPPEQFCVIDITKPGYVYIPSVFEGDHCGVLTNTATFEPE